MAEKPEDPLVKLIGGMSAQERRVLQKSIEGGASKVGHFDHHSVHFSTNLVRFGYFSDPHIGNKCFDWKLWKTMCAFFKKVGIKVVYSPGDIVDGMSGRPGSIYELDAIGFQAHV